MIEKEGNSNKFNEFQICQIFNNFIGVKQSGMDYIQEVHETVHCYVLNIIHWWIPPNTWIHFVFRRHRIGVGGHYAKSIQNKLRAV